MCIHIKGWIFIVFIFLFKTFIFFLVECSPGYYGSNCSSSCSSYCQEKACDRYTGECLYGCTPGYQQPDCSARKIYVKLSCFAFLMYCAITKNHIRFVVLSESIIICTYIYIITFAKDTKVVLYECNNGNYLYL